MKPRRRVLAGLTVLLAPLPLQAQGSRPVVVIGAGLAGQGAGRTLVAAGHRVTVVDACDRIGGRVWTSRMWPDLQVDRGAGRIRGIRSNPLTALAENAGAVRVPTSCHGAMTHDATGRAFDFEPAWARADGAVDAARAAVDDTDENLSQAEAVKGSKGGRQAGTAERRLISLFIYSTVEQQFGGDWAKASAWYFDDGEECEGRDALFPGGHDQSVTGLAQGLTFRLGDAVIAPAPSAEGVAVTLAGGEVLSSDHAVDTMPTGVRQSEWVRFAEALGAARQAATDGLRLDSIALPGDVDRIEWLGPSDGHWAEWVSLVPSMNAPVLPGFNARTQALETEALNDAPAANAAREGLRAVFGTSFPAPVASQIGRWSRDAFAQGFHSFDAAGGNAATRKALAGADRDGRLIFAGEAASSDHPGAVHGGLMSGLGAENLAASLVGSR